MNRRKRDRNSDAQEALKEAREAIARQEEELPKAQRLIEELHGIQRSDRFAEMFEAALKGTR